MRLQDLLGQDLCDWQIVIWYECAFDTNDKCYFEDMEYAARAMKIVDENIVGRIAFKPVIILTRDGKTGYLFFDDAYLAYREMTKVHLIDKKNLGERMKRLLNES